MSFNEDDEILQDFLVEAGEILETLNEELVDLEKEPDNADKINSVFRGFHTIKGGAGFLSLTPLVELCHRSEDVFGLIRTGELHINPKMMDVFLDVLDSLNSMFDDLKAAQTPEDADLELLKALDQILAGGAAETIAEEPVAVAEEPVATKAENTVQDGNEQDVTDEEFEQLLDALDDNTANKQSSSDVQPIEAAGEEEVLNDEISDDEFDNLLEQLHGKTGFNPDIGKNFEQNNTEESNASDDSEVELFTEDTTEGENKNSDNISDDEFERYLDELHGKGKFSVPQVSESDKKEETTNAAESAHQQTPSQNIEDKGTAENEEENDNEQAQTGELVTSAVKRKDPPVSIEKVKPATSKPRAKKEVPVQSETTVRVDTKRLDDIMNMVGELVLVRNRLVTLDNFMSNEDLSKAVKSLDVVTSDLQTSVMKTRMQPVKKVFGRFPRVVRDISRTMKKEVQLILVGEDTDLDKNLVEALADPLVHLVRNSVDHGIEIPEVREQNDKPRQGTVTLAATQEGDHILLTIEDDGAGMDAELLRKKVVEKGLMDEEAAARLNESECYSLIFMPGFSTKDVISDVSGRGVGMDVVKTRISQLNGAVEIDSQLGKGTRISIMVPLTLAIMPTLMVKLKDQSFALPLVSVSEIFHLDLTKTNLVDNQLVIMVRNKPLPLFYLSKWLVKGAEFEELPNKGHVVVVNVGTKQVGFVVNELIGQEEVVIKPLGVMLQGTPGLAGATITGDGQIALIVDIPSLMSSHA